MVLKSGHVLSEVISSKEVGAALQEGTLQVILVAKTMDTNPDLQIVVSTDPFVIAAVDASGETDGKALGVKENDPRYAKKNDCSCKVCGWLDVVCAEISAAQTVLNLLY